MGWFSHEELLFRTMERAIVQNRLDAGFEDVDDFMNFSLSVQNRRKSRAGYALENHLERILSMREVAYSRGKATEGRSTTDFVFPGIAEYKDPKFPTEGLTMLGVKSTCKDRWRQVLAEAKRVSEKHLLTLEPSISLSQTEEMRSHFLRLVLPTALHGSYLPEQQEWLMSVHDFVSMVSARQTA